MSKNEPADGLYEIPPDISPSLPNEHKIKFLAGRIESFARIMSGIYTRSETHLITPEDLDAWISELKEIRDEARRLTLPKDPC